jgi:putative heme-binding domain-containing protein
VRLDGARLVQIALGDVAALKANGTIWEGYSRRGAGAVPDEVRRALRTALAAPSPPLVAEAARALAMVEDDSPAALAALARRLTASSHPADDIHLLAVIARLKAPRDGPVTRAVAGALVGLDEKVTARRLIRESNWPLRLAELHAGLAARDEGLNEALIGHKGFGRADHAVFTRAKGFDRRAAGAKFLARSAKEEDFAWSAQLVALVGELPAKVSLPALRKLWGEHGLDDAILPALAKHADAADRPRFLAMLGAARPATVRAALAALEKLPLPKEGAARGEEALALLRGVRLVGPAKEEEKLRAALLARVARLAGRKLTDEAAVAWLAKGWPKLASTLGGADGVDVAGWRRRLAKIDWDRGDAARGKQVYTKASCAQCHSGVAALGPDLTGVTGRFSRDDLFTAILQPSKDVSPRYRTTQLTTAAGTAYQGVIVYEAVDSVLMLTGAGQSVRLAHKQISERRPLASSLMPAGLLDRLSDGQIADLYAYLKSLAPKAPAKGR